MILLILERNPRRLPDQKNWRKGHSVCSRARLGGTKSKRTSEPPVMQGGSGEKKGKMAKGRRLVGIGVRKGSTRVAKRKGEKGVGEWEKRGETPKVHLKWTSEDPPQGGVTACTNKTTYRGKTWPEESNQKNSKPLAVDSPYYAEHDMGGTAGGKNGRTETEGKKEICSEKVKGL